MSSSFWKSSKAVLLAISLSLLMPISAQATSPKTFAPVARASCERSFLALLAIPAPDLLSPVKFGPADLQKYPSLAQTYSHYAQMDGMRGPDGWKHGLTEEQKQNANLAALNHNLQYSRTATYGKSNKGFLQDAADVKEKAQENILTLYSKIKSWSVQKIDSPADMKKLIMEANSTVTDGLNSVRAQTDQVAQPGQIRNYPIGREARQGLDLDGLPARLDDLSEKLFDLLKAAEQGKIDPVDAAARAYFLHDQLKPFFDGNGRTALALTYFFLERMKLPLPTLIGEAEVDLKAMKHVGGYLTRSVKDPESLGSYIQQSVKETQRRILQKTGVPPSAPNDLPGTRSQLLGTGVQGDVFLLKHDNGTVEVEKIAKSVAATEMMRREHEVSQIFATLPKPQRQHFAASSYISKDGALLRKEFVDGKTGAEILNSGMALDVTQRAELEKVFLLVKAFEQKYNIFLDFKPKNLIWSPERNTWVFVDLGPKFLPFDEDASFDEMLRTYWNPSDK